MPRITTGFILRPHARIQIAIVSYIAYLPHSQIITVLDVAYLPHSQIVTVLDIIYLSHLQIITVLDIVYLAHLQIAIYRPGGYRKKTIQFLGLFSIFWTYSRCMNGHPRRFKEITRMELPTFLAICQDLQEVELKETLNVSVEEQLTMFLSVVGHGWSNRDVQERFQHSGETVYR